MRKILTRPKYPKSVRETDETITDYINSNKSPYQSSFSKKLISIILTISIIVGASYNYPVNKSLISNAETIDEVNIAPQISDIDAPDTTPEVIGELKELREKYTKQFLQTDGTTATGTYTSAMHYFHDGKYEEIDNNLEEKLEADGNAYLSNKKNDFNIKFAKNTSSRNLVKYKYKGYEISWRIPGIANTLASLKAKSNVTIDKQKLEIENKSGAVKYSSISKDTDLEYIVKGDTVKENITLHSAQASNTISFMYDFGELVPTLNEDNLIALKTKTTNETLLVFSPPYMYDANYESSDGIALKLEQVGREYSLSLTADRAWLDMPNRKYPVVIDPTLSTPVVPSTIKDTYAYEGNPGSYQYRYYEHLRVGKSSAGNVFRSLSKFSLPTLKSSDNVTQAILRLTTYDSDPNLDSTYTLAPYVYVHNMTTAWDNTTLTWNTLWSSNTNNGFDSLVTDYCKITGAGTYQWDITKIASDWYKTGVNNGVMLKYADESNSGVRNEIFFTSSDYNNIEAPQFPAVIITYRNTSGLEGYYSYHEQSTGRAGTGYLNDYTGNLVFVHHDASTPGGLFPISLNHVYGNDKKISSTTYNSTTNIPKYGNGFSLDAIQRIDACNSELTAAGYPYKYTDGDGTEHYFYHQSSDPANIYVDEDGLSLKLEVFSSAQEGLYWYFLTDNSGIIYKFDKANTTGGFLRKTLNLNGKYIQYNYTVTNGVNRLTKIIDGAGSELNLAYGTDNLLTSITDSSGRVTTYTYYNQHLTRITYPDSTASEYNYSDASTYLTWVTNIDGYKVLYDYTTITPYRVSQIDEKNKTDTSIQGNSLGITYGYNETKFHDLKDTSHTNDIQTYQFTTWGNTVGVHDMLGNAGNYKYNNSANSLKNYSIAQTADVKNSVVNLLMNSSYESDLTDWTIGANVAKTVQAVTTQNYIGDKSLYVNTSTAQNNSYAMGYTTSLSTLAAGTYTVSGYVKTSSVANNDPLYTGLCGAGIELRIENNSVPRWVVSEFIKGTTDASVENGWTRVSATFTLNSGDSLVQVMFGIFSATGSAYFDAVQLEKGETMNQYNLVQNSSFEKNSGPGTTPNYWTASNMTTGSNGISNGNVADGAASYKISGDPAINKNIYQNIKVKGTEGDVFSISGWAVANSISGVNPSYLCSIAVRMDFADGDIIYNQYLFNTNVNTKQNLSVTFAVSDNDSTKTQNYTQMFVFFTYYTNVNTAYFDDMQMYKDSAQSYQYDSNNKLISTADKASQDSSFAYQNDNLSKMVNPNGSSYEYAYDSKKRVTNAKTSSGERYEFSYDSNGNPISSAIKSDSVSTAIIPDNTYYIRSKISGKYLNVNSNVAGTSVTQKTLTTSTSQQKWKVVSAGDGYFKLIPQNATDKVLHVRSNSSSASAQIEISLPIGASGEYFKLVLNEDKSYKIASKSSGDKLCFDVQGASVLDDANILQYTDLGQTNQCWYFEDTDKVSSSVKWDTPTGGFVYNIRAKHSSQYIDVTNNGTSSGTEAIQYFLKGGENQQFKVLPGTGTGYYKLSPLHAPGMVLGVDSNVTPKQIKLYSIKTISDEDQNFKFVKAADGTYQIVSKIDNALAFDVRSASYSYSEKIDVTTTTSGDNKYFIFEEVAESINSSSSYSSNGNYLTSVKDSSGNTVNYSYNTTKGTLSDVTLPGETSTTNTKFEYDPNTYALNKVTKLNGSQTIENQYTYDFDKLSAITHNGFDYTFEYDKFGNNTIVKAGGNTLVTNTYKPNNGLLDYITYGNTNKVGYVYDVNTRAVTKLLYNNVEKFNYTYDNSGNLYKKQDLINNQTIQYFYDFIDRPLKVINSNGYTVNYFYDSKNRLSSYKNSFGGKTTTTEFVYGNALSNTNPGLVYNVKDAGVNNVTYTYDRLSRLTKRSALGYIANYTYVDGDDENKTTTKLESITNSGTNLPSNKISYTYDVKGNITTISENSVLKATYFYDNFSQLIRENNLYINKTIVYSYDVGGNITEKKEYDYTTQSDLSLLNPTLTIPYAYTDSTWKDLLTSYNGNAITYDNIGNPLTIGSTQTLTWENGRRLSSITKNAQTSIYKYDDNGIRTSKTVGAVTTNYYLQGDRVEIETNGTDTIRYYYDEKGDLFKFNVTNSTYPSGTDFVYVRNGQNDIIGIADTSTNPVVSYVYDSWGKLISTTGTLANTIGAINPYRYRGYRYDNETGLFYVGSRYYDPTLGRFINADDPGILDGGNDHLLENNLFMYCFNNPVNMTDEDGYWPTWAKIAVGVGIIAGLAVLTVFTGGVAGVIAGAALSGAIAGGGSGAIAGAIGGGLSGGGWKGALDGAADGFMKGAIIGGATGALSAGANVATGAVKIVGSAQKTGTLFHRAASNIQAGKMAMQVGRYSKIGLDVSLKKVGLVGRKMPDVIGVARFGTNKLVEVVSKSQTITQMANKCVGMCSVNSNTTYSVISWAAKMSRLI